MSLLDKLSTTPLGLEGRTPGKFSDNPTKKQELNGPGLTTSQLDLDGKTPAKYQGASQYQRDLALSKLDLDGKTPKRYQNPETGTTYP